MNSRTEAIRDRIRQALQPLTDADANEEHIKKQVLKSHRASKLAATLVRQAKTDHEESLAALENYLDDYAFHTGGIHTPEDQQNAMESAIHRELQRRAALAAARQATDEDEEDQSAIGRGWGDTDRTSLSDF
ncbi:MAG: hypothetical protein WBM24_08575 [Candidatus Sulfotelmatobacter sp.]